MRHESVEFKKPKLQTTMTNFQTLLGNFVCAEEKLKLKKKRFLEQNIKYMKRVFE